MSLKSIAKAPGSGFDTYLLGIEETWWVRDHPFNARCVKVKGLVRKIETAELELATMRKSLDDAVATMNEERTANGS